MLIVGRITKDAIVNRLKDERSVVNFSVAVNDWYKPRGQEQGVKVTTYFNCSFWRSPQIAERLNKGTLVELSGRVSVNLYRNVEDEPKVSLNFHVNTIKIHQSAKAEIKPDQEDSAIAERLDDLPF